jgi:hypothetical protein
LESARVECDSGRGGTTVSVAGLAHAGTTRVFVVLDIDQRLLLVTLETPASLLDPYSNDAPGPRTVVITSGGAHVNGTVAVDGHPELQLRISGDVTCGSTVHN